MYRYEAVVVQVREWIATGLLKPGDRLLSVRELSTKLGYSTVTVHQALTALQDEGILHAEPRSGFYVSSTARQLPEFTLETDFVPSANGGATPGTGNLVAGDAFSVVAVSEDLTPIDELYRLMASNIRWEGAKAEVAPQLGIAPLREAVARRVIDRAPSRRVRDIVIASNKLHALDICLDILLPRPGKVLVETPTDPRIVSALLRRKVEIVEIYSHPRLGLDPDQLEHLTRTNEIALCILSLTNHIPTGISYGESVAKRVAQIAAERGMPIIEDMPSQGIVHDEVVMGLAEFDTKNTVFRIGSFSDSLGERFGLGWVALPHKFHDQIRPPPTHNLAGEWARQKAVAEFIGRRTYDKHVKKIKEAVSNRLHKGLSLVFQHFPENCAVSRPPTGYMCWVRGPKDFNALTLRSEKALMEFLAPGPLFSCTRAFGNFFSLNLSHPWTPERERELARLGQALARASSPPGGGPG
jgi:DNA-binding transcriptional MocR family regulator